MLTNETVDAFVGVLRRRGLAPKNIEVTSVGSSYLVNCYDSLKGGTITDSVTTGVDVDLKVALLKSVTESVERRVLAQNLKHADPSNIGNFRSDGTAAFPVFSDRTFAVDRTRENAIAEAVERYGWAHWWDDPSISAQISKFDLDGEFGHSRSLVNHINAVTPLGELFLIKPDLNMDGVELCILIARRRSGGFLSGGAAGDTKNTPMILYRGLSEMLRHSLAIRQMETSGVGPDSFYEQRLHYFGSGQGDDLVLGRLATVGNRPVEFTDLSVDRELTHTDSDIVYVHRCYFKDQPPFVGGALERLCI